MTNQYDVIILGGGAAGLMCALTAGHRGQRVLVIEKSNKLGKKILMSGGGRCNFTNLNVLSENYICPNPHFVKSALSQYTQWDFIALVEKHGITYHEKKHGQLFCNESAKDILTMLVDECSQAGVTFILNCEAQSIKYESCYQIKTNQGSYSTTSLVLATGGLSIPTLGGSGFAYDYSRQRGLHVNNTEASLVPLTLTGQWHELAKSLSGVSLPVTVSVPQKSFLEDMLFTHRGLSGPAILQLSNYWHVGDNIKIDFVPNHDLSEYLLRRKKQNPHNKLSTVLVEFLPRSFVQQFLLLIDEKRVDTNLQEIKNTDLEALAKQMNAWTVKPSGTEGYRTAEVTRGGIDVSQISSKTMRVEGLSNENLYIIGEALDVTGHLGGYNFQWAWASGYVAGLNVV